MASDTQAMSSSEPVMSSEAEPTVLSRNSDHGDIWEDVAETQSENLPTHNNDSNNDKMLSELPTIKRQQMNDGYREGLSAGKAQVMQGGFDEGYPIGIQIAQRAGKILGILEGYLACKSLYHFPGLKELVQKTLDEAKADLDIKSLLFNLDEDELATPKQVPARIETLLLKWEGTVTGVLLTRKFTLDFHEQENHGLRNRVASKESTSPPLHDEILDQLTKVKVQKEAKTGSSSEVENPAEGWLGRRSTYW